MIEFLFYMIVFVVLYRYLIIYFRQRADKKLIE